MGVQPKILWRPIFLGASENDNVGDFPLRSDGWKNLMRQKPPYILSEASQHENIPRYLMTSETGNLIE